MDIKIREVAGEGAFSRLLALAESMEQARYLTVQRDYYDESILLGAFGEAGCVGFLRCVVQVIGSDEGRPPIYRQGVALREGYVEAFGVSPSYRRRGIGQRLQERALALCRDRGCYQIRSRSPLSSVENYALKLKMGYAIHPSSQNDSYYFIKTLG
jgi:GNAT superfamily N-acetyltransferase